MNDRRGRHEDRLVRGQAGDEGDTPSRRADEAPPGAGPRPTTSREHRDGSADVRTDPPGDGPGEPSRDASGGGYEGSPDRTPPSAADRLEGPNGHPHGGVFGGGAPTSVADGPGDLDPDPAHREDRAHRTTQGGLADPVDSTIAGHDVRPGGGLGGGGLFDQDPEETRRRWQEVQAGFVDDPRDAVERADSLVAEITGSLLTALENRTAELQDRRRGSGRRDTEDLRTDLRDYRALLEQLLDLSTGTR